MKNLNLTAIAFFFIGLFIMASCKSGSYNPASFSIEKRKYNTGFYSEFTLHKKQNQKIEETEIERKSIIVKL